MRKTFGLLALVENQWQMTNLPPHVVIRLKQLFPRIPKWQTGTFVFPNDDTHCTDLTWFQVRYPMEMNDIDKKRLHHGRDSYEATQVRMEEILRPDYQPSQQIGLKPGQSLRHYQLQAIDLFLARKSLLIGDDVGLGKTYEAIGAMLALLAIGVFPFAVVMQTHLQEQWKSKIEEFSTLRVHKIKGTKPYNLPPADVYLFKYSQLLGWIDTFEDGFFKGVFYDEVQELRTGLKSGKGQAAKRLSEAAEYRLALSATPIYNYGVEIWNIMQAVNPLVLGSFEDFLREWCVGDKEVKDPDALGTFLREQYVLLRRTKQDVSQELPPINTIIEHVEFDNSALKSVEDLARQLAVKTTTGTFMERGRAGRELDLLMRHTTGVAKAISIARYAKIFLEANIPITLVGWHRDVYDIWLKELKEYNPAMYTGSESEKQKNESVRRFLQEETNLFILSLRSGAGLDGLQHRCSTVLIGELDWSPKVHEQLIGRFDREGQTEQITSMYLVADEGSDPPMIEVLGIKNSQATGIIDPGKQFTAKHTDKSRIQALASQFLEKTNQALIQAALK